MDTLFPYTTLFRSLEVYRKGHLVWLLDKSSWLYINAVPTSGNAPPAWPTTSNAYWQNMTPPSIASDRSPTPPEELPEGTLRSEEHTSELQSLMRISYAVFCLKKKK